MKRKGLAQIPVLIGLLLMAVAIPVATKLVQTNQENRGKATGACPGTETCRYGISDCGANGYYSGTGTCPGGKCCGGPVPTGNDKCTNGPKYCAGGKIYVCKADKSGYTSSSCASGACSSSTECKAEPTDTPNNPTKVPTKTPTSVPGCINNGVCKKTGVSCCSGYSATVATSVCSTGKKCVAAVPTPTLGSGKANGEVCTSHTECQSGNCMAYSTQVKTCQNKRTNGESCVGNNNCISNKCITGICVAITPTKIPTAKPTLAGAACKAAGGRCLSSGNPSCNSGEKLNTNLGCPRADYGGVPIQGCCLPGATPTVKVCRSDVDYNKDGVVNSLDMIYCSLH